PALSAKGQRRRTAPAAWWRLRGLGCRSWRFPSSRAAANAASRVRGSPSTVRSSVTPRPPAWSAAVFAWA
ncbi:unnamed protein product, partial [Symbiodinium sp. CCMP2592]